MTTLSDIPVAEIGERARRISFGHVLVTLVIGFFFAIGWLAGRSWLAACFCAVAVKVGWQEGTGQRRDLRDQSGHSAS